jgi:hypothetical protein
MKGPAASETRGSKEVDVNARKLGTGFAAAILMLGGFAWTAQAGDARSPGDRKIAALTKQVAALTKEVKALKAQMSATREQLRLNSAGDTCLGAMQADLLQGTWGVIDEIAQATQSQTYFGQQVQVADYLNCAFLGERGVVRPAIQVPPTIRVLDPLLLLLHAE